MPAISSDEPDQKSALLFNLGEPVRHICPKAKALIN